MDDKFLFQLREQPDREFVKRLQQRLTEYQPCIERKLNMKLHTFTEKLRPKFAWAVLAALAICALMVTITPVRAFLTSLTVEIAGQSFEVTGDYPGDNYSGAEKIIEPQVVSLEQALSVLPFSIKLPAYTPTGSSLDEDNVRVFIGDQAGPFRDTVEFQWTADSSRSYRLRISGESTEIVAPDSIEPTFLAGNYPAVVIRGGWNVDGKAWNQAVTCRLKWTLDGLTYDLMGDDLVEMYKIASSTLE
jgi:hypothetical protein